MQTIPVIWKELLEESEGGKQEDEREIVTGLKFLIIVPLPRNARRGYTL